MSVPLRKERPEAEEQLSTADLAQGKRPSTTQEVGPKPVLSEPAATYRAAKAALADREIADAAPLFPNNELDDLRNRWNGIQGAFVDEPRRAVEQADALVASAMQRLAEVFADERSRLEKQWDRGDNVSTEDLRIALQRYRSFFHRLLTI